MGCACFRLINREPIKLADSSTFIALISYPWLSPFSVGINHNLVLRYVDFQALFLI